MKTIKALVFVLLLATVALAQVQIPYTYSNNNPSANAPGGNCFTNTTPVYNYLTATYWYCVPNTTPPLNLGTWTSYASAPTTGSGSTVLATSPTLTSPTLVTPALGTPSSGVLTNATGFPPALVHLNVEKTLALTDLQTLNSVPYQIIAPPGATSMIQMGSCTLNLTRGSAAFTGGGTVSIGYDTTSSPATNGTIASTVFTTFAASHGVVVLPVAVAVTATTGLANKGIYITAASADFAAGTGATGQLNCDYSVVTGVQ